MIVKYWHWSLVVKYWHSIEKLLILFLASLKTIIGKLRTHSEHNLYQSILCCTTWLFSFKWFYSRDASRWMQLTLRLEQLFRFKLNYMCSMAMSWVWYFDFWQSSKTSIVKVWVNSVYRLQVVLLNYSWITRMTGKLFYI